MEPLDEAKSLERLRRAAIDEFAEHGFEKANIGRIATTAGMSKKTIYRFVASKEDLFLSTAEERLRAIDYATHAAASSELSCRKRLERFLLGFGMLALSDDGIAFYRVMMREGMRFPQIATGYAEAMAKDVIAPLEEILQSGCATGEIVAPDPNRAARMLVSMTFAEPMHDTALGMSVPRDTVAIEERVAAALQVFMDGCARQAPQA